MCEWRNVPWRMALKTGTKNSQVLPVARFVELVELLSRDWNVPALNPRSRRTFRKFLVQ